MNEMKRKEKSLFDLILSVVSEIPYGKVASYGQVGALAGGCSGRLVGFALAGSSRRTTGEIPWQRVINARGRISLKGPDGALQRQLLEDEGVHFHEDGSIDWSVYRWEA